MERPGSSSGVLGRCRPGPGALEWSTDHGDRVARPGVTGRVGRRDATYAVGSSTPAASTSSESRARSLCQRLRTVAASAPRRGAASDAVTPSNPQSTNRRRSSGERRRAAPTSAAIASLRASAWLTRVASAGTALAGGRASPGGRRPASRRRLANMRVAIVKIHTRNDPWLASNRSIAENARTHTSWRKSSGATNRRNSRPMRISAHAYSAGATRRYRSAKDSSESPDEPASAFVEGPRSTMAR